METKIKTSLPKELEKLKNFCKVWWPLLIFGVVFLVCATVLYRGNYDVTKTLFVNIASIWDISASVALSVLAAIAYWRYSIQANKESKYLENLRLAHDIGQNHRDGVIIIHAGGSNPNAVNEAKAFFSEKLGLPDELILSMQFGDKNHKISKSDIQQIEDWLRKECMAKLIYASEIHIIVIGVGIVFAVAADTLKNWKTIKFYHNQNGYELWYIDSKSRNKADVSNPIEEAIKK